jgi:hypothetical protein
VNEDGMKNGAEEGSVRLAALEMRDVFRIDRINPEKGDMAR